MSLVEAAERARHDLGKYVALQSRWLPENADAAALREALRTDLTRTRSGPSGTADAATVWGEARAELQREGAGRPDVAAVITALDAEMAALATAAASLDTLGVPELRRAADLARGVGERLRDLHRRLAREEGE